MSENMQPQQDQEVKQEQDELVHEVKLKDELDQSKGIHQEGLREEIVLTV